jgi:hypothetical protein
MSKAALRRISSVALVLFLVPVPALADTLTGKVVTIVDGDTITVLDSIDTQHRIRLQGIDAPFTSIRAGPITCTKPEPGIASTRCAVYGTRSPPFASGANRRNGSNKKVVAGHRQIAAADDHYEELNKGRPPG